MSVSIRIANETDAQQIADIYAPIVRDTFTSFETEPPRSEEMSQRISNTLRTHPWLVAEIDNNIAGYAYASQYRSRAAYQWSVDVSAYVAEQHQGQGIGRSLYDRLFYILRLQGFIMAHAGIALPNIASVTFHEKLGFKPIGIYTQVGFKKGSWRDVGWWNLKLQEQGNPPDPPACFSTIRNRI